MTQPKKPGWKTTEFLLTAIAMIVSILIAGDIFGDETMGGKVLAFAASCLGVLGYSISRAIVKRSENLTDAVLSKNDPDLDQ